MCFRIKFLFKFLRHSKCIYNNIVLFYVHIYTYYKLRYIVFFCMVNIYIIDFNYHILVEEKKMFLISLQMYNKIGEWLF